MRANTNWQDEIFRTGATQNYNLAASGGSENSNYSALDVVLGIRSFNGVIPTTETFNSNANSRIKLKMEKKKN